MIYEVNSDYFYSFLKDAIKYEQKWNKKFGPKPKDPIEKISYIDMINNSMS
tara:strand:- start:580 stop:732 length:153 start_codon:yes stop_codon:yes gene_type:complete